MKTANNAAGLFTKVLSQQPFEKHRRTVLDWGARAVAALGARASMSGAAERSCCGARAGDAAGPCAATRENGMVR